MNQKCLEKMRDIYAEFDSADIAHAIKIIRAELTNEADRHQLQVEILEKQRQLDCINNKNIN